MKTLINEAIQKHKAHTSFHTPAHSGVLNSFDITELSFSDNLLNPEGVIAKSQKELALSLKTDNSIYLTGGGTSAVHISLYAIKNKTLLIAGCAHKSVFSAVKLYNIKAYYCFKAEQAEEAIEKFKIDAVLITSPNYFGMVKNREILKRISQKTILLVDESHGAHFPYSQLLPQSALGFAHIVIQSCHKTLPALTGSALLHFKEEFKLNIINALKLIHSTSPQYPLIASVEQAVADFLINGESYYKEISSQIDEFKNTLSKPFGVLGTHDKTRLVILSPYDVNAVALYLEENGIFLELAFKNMLVFIVTKYNFKKLNALAKALNQFCRQSMPNAQCAIQNEDINLNNISGEIFNLNGNLELMQTGLDNGLLFMLK